VPELVTPLLLSVARCGDSTVAGAPLSGAVIICCRRCCC
jgi:hypothetical protein